MPCSGPSSASSWTCSTSCCGDASSTSSWRGPPWPAPRWPGPSCHQPSPPSRRTPSPPRPPALQGCASFVSPPDRGIDIVERLPSNGHSTWGQGPLYGGKRGTRVGARRTRAASGNRGQPLRMQQVRALQQDAGGGERREGERGGTHPADVRPSNRRVQGAGATGGLTGAARKTGSKGREGTGARGAAALERLGHGAQAGARALVDAGSENGDRQRARGADRQASGAARPRAHAAVAERERGGAVARARHTGPRRHARGQRGGGHHVRAQAGFAVVRVRVAAVVQRAFVRDVARRDGSRRRRVHRGRMRNVRARSGGRTHDRLATVTVEGGGARGRSDSQRSGEHDRGEYDPCGGAHVSKHRRAGAPIYQERANS